MVKGYTVASYPNGHLVPLRIDFFEIIRHFIITYDLKFEKSIIN